MADSNVLANEVEHILKEIEELHKASRYFQAEEQLTQLRAESNFDESQHWFISDLETKCAELKRLKAFLQSEEGWTIAHTTQKWTTEYKPDEETGFHNFRVSGVVDIDLFKVAAVCLETELFYKWMPFCSESNVILRTAEFGRLVHLLYKLWWPLSTRELVLDAYGCDNVRDADVLVFARSVDTHPQAEIPDAGNNTRVNMIQAGFYFKALGGNKVQIVIVAQLDPGVMVPQFMINWISGKVMHMIPDGLAQAADFDDDSEYAERVRENPKLYDRIRAILEELEVTMKTNEHQV